MTEQAILSPPSASRPSPAASRMFPKPGKLDFGALLPGVGVFGGVRRFVEVGNELVRRGHRYVIYHPAGTRPEWLPFAGEVQPLAALAASHHDVLINNDTATLKQFGAANAKLKLFYCVIEKLQNERSILTDSRWTILANSSGIQERIWKKYGVHAEPVIGGLDARVFRLQSIGPSPEGPLRILAYGRVSRRAKGVPLVVRAAEAFARSTRLRRAVQLVLFDDVGPGNEQDPRDRVHSSVPIEFHLNLPQAELASLYASCHVFVSAERKAGWSNTVAEAMACGVPVVCTRSGTRDLALHRETAWVVRWRHPWFLKRGVQALLENATLAQHLRNQAHARVQHFTWPHVVDQLEAAVLRKLP